MSTVLIAAIPTILGIISTLVAYYFNPKRKLYAQANEILLQWEALNVIRDKALEKNDSDSITVVTAQLNELRKRKADILQQLR